MIGKIFKWLAYPILAFGISYLLRDTVYYVSNDRIGPNDFAILKNECYPDIKTQLKAYFVKNLSSYPINSDNVFINYKSNQLPKRIFITNSNGVSQAIHIENNKNQIFNSPLPKQLRNEDYFTISILYDKQTEIDDQLKLKVVTNSNEKFTVFGEGDVTQNSILTSVKKTTKIYKTIIVVETGIILLILLWLVTDFFNFQIQSYKQRQDKGLLKEANKFIKND